VIQWRRPAEVLEDRAEELALIVKADAESKQSASQQSSKQARNSKAPARGTKVAPVPSNNARASESNSSSAAEDEVMIPLNACNGVVL